MDLRYNGGDPGFFSAPFTETGAFSTIVDSKVVFSTASSETVMVGSGFTAGVSGLPGDTGTVTGVTYKQGGAVIARFTDLSWAMSALLPALLAIDVDDYTGINALLSGDVLNINAVGASDAFKLPTELELDGGVVFRGSSHNDMMTSGDGDDELSGRSGRDSLDGGAGDDTVEGGAGNDELGGGSGNDNVSGNTGHDAIYGGSGDDTLNGDGGKDYISGGDDDDQIFGGGGKDEIEGGNGNDIISAGKGHDSVDGGAGDDQIDGDGGHDKLYGGADNDIIRGGSGKDRIEGGDGNDILGGNSGKDTIKGGAGNDFIVGGSGKDVLYGGTEADQFIFNHAKDSGKGKFSDTIMDFEQGVDFLDFSAFGAEFIGDAKFSGTGAEVQATNDGSGNSILIVDVNGDGKGDMRIDVMGVEDLMADSFVTLDPA
ncbi:calcium-binding protein [Neptunicoccus cionae]|uniref:calcium-binding protein n=1 Tax=Neptunicoccus cionae TaxID=2035344 RepID=UPI000C75930C|nr:calcium-binding protein [Amylibacter cionae]PLS23173.1 hypothetical protein C0U40_03285 [Amylibacter cionae]